MPEKPATAAGYAPEQVARVKATCLYLATTLGDLMPELVVVGGLVPSLLIDQENLPENVAPHVGTMDLDLGLAFALVGAARYQGAAARLRTAGFTPDKNDEGKTARQRWRISDPPVTVDFLIEPEKSTEAEAGKLGGDHRARIASGLSKQPDGDLERQNHRRGSRHAGHPGLRRGSICGAEGAGLSYSRREKGRLRFVLPAAELRSWSGGRGGGTESVAVGC
jgi:hypothetical protein